MKSDGEIKEAMDVLYRISGDKDSVRLAEMREKAIMDEQSRLSGAREEGKKEGIKEGIIEIVINLITKRFKDLPSEYMEKIKKLSEKKAKTIANDIFEIETLEDLLKYLN